MLNHISPFIYTAICNYVEQNELIDTLYNKGFINDSDMPVSYTHLDVYKRQGLYQNNIPFLASLIHIDIKCLSTFVKLIIEDSLIKVSGRFQQIQDNYSYKTIMQVWQ